MIWNKRNVGIPLTKLIFLPINKIFVSVLSQVLDIQMLLFSVLYGLNCFRQLCYQSLLLNLINEKTQIMCLIWITCLVLVVTSVRLHDKNLVQSMQSDIKTMHQTILLNICIDTNNIHSPTNIQNSYSHTKEFESNISWFC